MSQVTTLLIDKAEACWRLAIVTEDLDETERLLRLASQYLSMAEDMMRHRTGFQLQGSTALH